MGFSIKSLYSLISKKLLLKVPNEGVLEFLSIAEGLDGRCFVDLEQSRSYLKKLEAGLDCTSSV